MNIVVFTHYRHCETFIIKIKQQGNDIFCSSSLRVCESIQLKIRTLDCFAGSQ